MESSSLTYLLVFFLFFIIVCTGYASIIGKFLVKFQPLPASERKSCLFIFSVFVSNQLSNSNV